MPLRKPNDPRYTSKLFLIEQHYENIEEDLEWTIDRLRRLCAALKLTEYELGALIRLRVRETTRILETGLFPRTAALNLLLIERTVLPTSKPPVFPSL